MKFTDELGCQSSVGGRSKFVLQVLRSLIVDEEIIFPGFARVVVAGAVWLVVFWERLDTARDVAE